MTTAISGRNFGMTLFAIAVAIGILIGLRGTTVTLSNYNKIQNGMTIEQVKEILGSPTEEQNGGVGPLEATSMVYRSRQNEITINFVNGKVVMKNGNLKQ